MAQGLGFRIWGLGCKVQGSGSVFRVGKALVRWARHWLCTVPKLVDIEHQFLFAGHAGVGVGYETLALTVPNPLPPHTLQESVIPSKTLSPNRPKP